MNERFDQFNKLFNTSDTTCYKLCKDKQPINKNLYTYDQIKDDTTHQIGWLISDSYIVVDIDNKKDSKKVYEILKSLGIKSYINSTKKGHHFYFRKPKRDIPQVVACKTSIGISIDTRTSGKGYILLPVNDTNRAWGEHIENVDELPFFLYPIKNIRNVPDFNSMGQGERNNSLFIHYMSLLDFATDLTIDQKTESIKLINEYLLDKPLSESELNIIVRNELVDKVKKKDATPEDIANKIVAENDIITIQERIHMYDGKYYQPVCDKKFHKFIHDNYHKKATDSIRKEICKFVELKTYVEEIETDKDWEYICLKNGRLNIKTLTMEEHSPSKLDTIYVNQEYKADCPVSNRVETFLTFLTGGDTAKRQLLLELIGYNFVKRNMFHVAFILYGDGRNGKSTFLQLIVNLIGAKNTSFVDMSDISDSEFKSIELYQKLSNIADDMSFRTIKETTILKKLISGDTILANRKYKDPVTFKNFATMIFSTNKLPLSSDKSFGFFRRLVLIDFERLIEKPDPYFLDRFEDVDYQYLLSESLAAISEAIKRKGFTRYAKSEQVLNDYEKSMSNVTSFVEDEGIDDCNIDKRSVNGLYQAYDMYCNQSGFKPLNKAHFNTEICKMFNLEKKVTTVEGQDSATRWIVRREE